MKRFRPLIVTAAQRHNLDPNLALAVAKQESNFNPDARGNAGELGLMQVTRNAARDWERLSGRTIAADKDLLVPELNVEVGVWYLARAMSQFEGYPQQDALALSQYNAGRQRARQWARDYGENLPERIPISSTRHYILQVREYRAAFGEQAAR